MCIWCYIAPIAVDYIHFFFNYTATTEIYTLSLHDALPIFSLRKSPLATTSSCGLRWRCGRSSGARWPQNRSEEHTSELQSRQYLVCRLLLEKKKTIVTTSSYHTSLWTSLSPI